MIGARKRAWRYYYVALALSWTVSYAPGYFTHINISITTPIVSAFKNYYNLDRAS